MSSSSQTSPTSVAHERGVASTRRGPPLVVTIGADDWPSEVVGGKANGLHRLVCSGFVIPPGFCITAHAFDRAAHGLVTNATTLAELREALTAAPLPPELVILVRQHIDAHPEQAWAVRSSALEEDAAGETFAGQQTTVLGVVGFEAVLDAMRQVWASLFSHEALLYRANLSLELVPRSMAVVVQQMVEPDTAGVLFTSNPLTGDGTEALVSAAPGRGTTVVEGGATHTYYVERPSGYLRRYLAPGAYGNRSEEGVLDPAALKGMSALAQRLERAMGHAVDVEWVLDHSRANRFASAEQRFESSLVLLQMRPLSRRASIGGDEPRSLWTNVNVGESLPGVATPMTWSLIRRFAETGFDRAFGSLGVDVPRDVDLVGSFRGRVYLNLGDFVRLASSVPFLSATTLFEMAGGAGAELAEEFAGREQTLSFLGKLPRTAARVALSQFALPIVGPLWDEHLKVERDRLFAEPLQTYRHADLTKAFAKLDRTFDYTGMVLLAASSNFVFAYAVARALAQSSGGEWAATRLPELIRGLGVESAEPGWKLRDLGRYAARHPAVREAFELDPDDPLPALRELAASDPAATRFLDMLDEFLAEFGHRAPGEAELATPRWREDPTFVLDVIAHHIDETSQRRATRSRDHARVLAEIDAFLRTEIRRRARVPLRLFLGWTRVAARLREALRARVVDTLGMYRLLLLECGRRLTAAGELDDPSDVFFLKYDEVLGWLGDAKSDLRLRVLVRKATFDEFAQLAELPTVFLWPGFEAVLNRPDVALDQTDVVVAGLPASAGSFTGVARILHSADEAHRVQPGEVLVARQTDIGWTPLFLSAGAVVTETGGPLSHSAIVAREYGIPAVANAYEATRLIVEGELVTVDGTTGVVRRQTRH